MAAVVRRTDINEDGAPIVRVIQSSVFANYLEISVDGSIVSDHGEPPPPPDGEEVDQETQPPGHAGVITSGGSTNVFIEGKPVNRITDEDSCSHARVTGSPNVFVGDNKATKAKEPELKLSKDSSGVVPDRKKYVESVGPNGERILTFQNGNTVVVDAYGNKIQSAVDRFGQTLYYIQAEQPQYLNVGAQNPVETWAPDGPIIYTDAKGNVISSVTYSPNSLESDGNGNLKYSDPITVTQSIPTGDPLPGNKNKW